MAKKIKLKDGEHIICCYGKHCAGPGWSNSPLWYLVRSRDGQIREECIQPQDRTNDMHTLFSVLTAAHDSMMHVLEQNTICKKGK